MSLDVPTCFVDNNGKSHNLLMTFDTGAYMTAIDSFTLAQAGYDLTSAKNAKVDTVGRKDVSAKEVLLRGLELLDLSGSRVMLGPVLVYAIDMSDIYTTGVLGLNVIREFETRIRFGKSTTIELLPNFDLNQHAEYHNFLRIGSRFGLWTPSQMNER